MASRNSMQPGLPCIALGMLLALPSQAQTQTLEAQCAPDELDMGDYCALLIDPEQDTGHGSQRITRFRGVGMMPGKKDRSGSVPAPAAEPDPVTPPANPAPAAGFLVQLGAFSSKEVAESVAGSVESPGLQVTVAPIESAERTLWVCYLGPYANRASAETVREQVRQDRRFRTAYIKPVETAIQQGLLNDSTEK